MTKLTAETLAGFNKFVADQKEVDGEATLTLATFGSDYTLVHDFVELASIKELTINEYKTGGYTALLDAIAKTVDATGNKLAAMKEEDRPSKVIFVIITDGQENYSREFNRAAVMERIKHQREKYSWEFVFLGCSMEQIAESMSLGITSKNSYAYTLDSAGITASYNSISTNMSTYRNGTAQQVNFFDQNNNATVNPDTTNVNIIVTK